MKKDFTRSTKFAIILGMIVATGALALLTQTEAGSRIGITLNLGGAGSTLDDGLVGEWTFDAKDMTASTIRDRTSNANNATSSGFVSVSSTTVYSTAGTYSFTVPAGVTSLSVEVWGAGGGGGDSQADSGSEAGGGGGAYAASSSVTVTPGSSYTVFVGAGGLESIGGGNPGFSGEDSYFNSSSFLMAKGGQGSQRFTGGAGGSAASSIGTIKFSGGSGGSTANSRPASGGGGGGSATRTGVGSNGASDTAGGAGGSGEGNGGNGGTSAPTAGADGNAPGGGGGGSGMTAGATGSDGGDGAAGRIRITMAVSSTISRGAVGQALKFDGVDDEVRIPQSASYPSGSAERSIAFWFNAQSFDTGIADVLMTYAEVPAAGRDFSFCAEDNAVSLTFNGHRLITPKNTLRTNEWHYVVGVVPPGTTQTSGVLIYLDGVLQTLSTEQGSAQTLNTVQSDIYLASENAAGFGAAALDDVRIYNRAISAAEIQQLYRMGATSKIQTTPNFTGTGSTLDDNLVGHWTFDGEDMPKGQVNDRSGNSNHFSQQQMSTSTAYAKGAIGQAVYFDNTNFMQRLSADGDTLDLNTDYTIAAWVNVLPDGGTNTVVKRGSASGSATRQQYRIAIDASNQILFTTSDGTTGDIDTYGTIPTNQWVHIVCTRDNSNNKICYANGVQSGSTGTASTAAYTGQSEAVQDIGNDDGGGNSMSGLIDDVRIYSRVLTLGEIQQLYKMGATSKIGVTPTQAGTGSTIDDNLTAHYTFDGKDMPKGQVNDRAGGFNGSLGLSSTSTAYTKGVLGQALQFDGVDDVVTVAGSTITQGQGQITQMAWIKQTGDGTGNGSNILFAGENANSAVVRLNLTFSDSTDTMACAARAPDGQASASGVSVSYPFERNVWYHIVCMIDVANDTGSAYINGVLQSATVDASYTSTAIDNTTPGTLRIAKSGNSSNVFQGVIDDVRYYHRLLTASEVRQIYNLGR